MVSEKFWLNDIKELISDKKYMKILPKCDGSMTKIEQVNAITRLCMYFIILIFLIDKDSGYNLVCLPIALITVGVVVVGFVEIVVVGFVGVVV